MTRGKMLMAWTKENAVDMSAVDAAGRLGSGVAEVLARGTGSWRQDWARQALVRMAARARACAGAHAGRHMAPAVGQFPCVTVFGSIPCGLDCRTVGEALRQKPLACVESAPVTVSTYGSLKF
ncbi:hypothetical protein HAX54_014083 [Datura stramonium]|uniref:Uncharacterized protein n=1 Tax=Datura stramonium TaxID=4076 RepID=A0ABS8TMH7_DATST|nr:hypothetical protein [Datura stramonium]